MSLDSGQNKSEQNIVNTTVGEAMIFDTWDSSKSGDIDFENILNSSYADTYEQNNSNKQYIDAKWNLK